MEKVTGLFGTIKRSFKNLTKREQVMIYGLVIIVVAAVLIFLIILPAMTHISELSNEVSELELQENEMRMTIAGADSYEQSYKDSEKRFNAFKKQMNTAMDPESLDELVTSFLVKSGLTPKNLNMTVLQQTQIPTFSPPPLAAEGAPAVGTDGALTEGESTDTGEDSTASSGVQAYLYTITISVEGDKTDLAKLTDNVKSTTGFELRNFSYTKGSDDMAEGITTKGTINALLSVYVYVDQETGMALPTLDLTELEEGSN